MGVNATCPPAKQYPNDHKCTDVDGLPSTCKDGQCQDVCGRLNMHKCYCNETLGTNMMCTRCCTDNTENKYVVMFKGCL